jgi:aryl-alcohol dehydrogenase-like predicted oxidoreductase
MRGLAPGAIFRRASTSDDSRQEGAVMKKRQLVSDGPEISVIGLGTWEAGGEWGANPPDEELIRAYHTGFDAGVTWIDTAEAYGSEPLVGRALSGHERVLVSTKLAPSPFGSGYDADGVRAGAEGSLRRLRRDVIDFYLLHTWVPDIDIETTWGAMAKLVDDGLVRFIGLSNFDREQVEPFHRLRPVDVIQPGLSMLFPPFRDLIAWCGQQGIGVISYGPLAFGLLTGTVTAETRFPPNDWRSGNTQIPVVRALYEALFAPDVIGGQLAKVEKVRAVAERRGCTLAQLALAWAFHQPGVTGVICGTRLPERALENAGAGDLELSAQMRDEIDRILAGSPHSAERTRDVDTGARRTQERQLTKS